MSKYLHYEGLKWLKNIDDFDAMSINEKSAIGYLLELDLQYCDELHELHNDYSLAPEKRAVSSDTLLKYCKKNADKYELKIGDLKKIIPNLVTKLIMEFITEIFSYICL